MAEFPRVYYPVDGVSVTITGGTINIVGWAQLWGEDATAARAAEVEATINRYWNRSFNSGAISVTCKMSVSYRGPSDPVNKVLQIETSDMWGPSKVRSDYFLAGQKIMRLNSGGSDVYSWTAAHEFGHVIGLKDRYSESIGSFLKGCIRQPRTTIPHKGYERNMMAKHLEDIELVNLLDLVSETQPSPSWINDDDQLRNWLRTHSAADIAALASYEKLDAIRTLMSGYVSDADIAGIVRILGSMTTPGEAKSARETIDLMSLMAHGQRVTLEIALRALPR